MLKACLRSSHANNDCADPFSLHVHADDSGSMVFEEGGERINDLKLILGRVAEVQGSLLQ